MPVNKRYMYSDVTLVMPVYNSYSNVTLTVST